MAFAGLHIQCVRYVTLFALAFLETVLAAACGAKTEEKSVG